MERRWARWGLEPQKCQIFIGSYRGSVHHNEPQPYFCRKLSGKAKATFQKGEISGLFQAFGNLIGTALH
jgi:hypothetical protein